MSRQFDCIRSASLALGLALALTGCDFTVTHRDAPRQTASPKPAAADPTATQTSAPEASGAPEASAAPDTAAPTTNVVTSPLMQAQVVLDRLGFTPGVIDGKPGLSTRNALSAFQEVHSLPVTGKLDAATQAALAPWSGIAATTMVTIPADFAQGPYTQIPNDPLQQAKLPCLCYSSLDEKLGERFHTTIDTLKALNPSGGAPPAGGNAASPASSYFHAGQTIRVPDVGGPPLSSAPGTLPAPNSDWQNTLATLGVSPDQPKAASLVVSKHKGTLKVYDDSGKLIAAFTATMGSTHDPLPLGHWRILGISYNPKYHYNPELFWDVSNKKPRAMLPSGPNGPVGVVWIDLSKKHYGIHGTPRPETIGRAESHGCVRLTNWDAARLAQMVSQRTKVTFAA